MTDNPCTVSAWTALRARLRHGNVVLLGAGPGQGKTLMGLELTVQAMSEDRQGAFFSLERRSGAD